MLQSADPHVLYSTETNVLVMQMHRPEKKNALTPSMYKALADGIKLADATDAIHVILIRGTDDCFTSGNDVNSFVTATQDPGERPSVQFMHALTHAKKPIIAAVSGLAIGIGTTLLLHCDLVYAAETCFLQLPFTRLGLCPEAGSSYLLPRQIGYQRAAELLLLGARINAQKACEFGIVTEVLAQDQYLAHALGRASELAALPTDAVQTSKRLLKAGQQQQLLPTIDLELAEFARLLQTDAAQAIMRAFLETRKNQQKTG
jgi:enoyl-CoA hydratase/carnithine racemase